MNDLERAWVAGFLDGEGCINISVSGKTRNLFLRVMVTHTNREILEMLRGWFGGDIHTTIHAEHPCWKPSHFWRVSNRLAKNLLKQVGPFLILKQPQLRVAEKFFSTFDRKSNEKFAYYRKEIGAYARMRPEVIQERLSLREELKKLNHKGISVN